MPADPMALSQAFIQLRSSDDGLRSQMLAQVRQAAAGLTATAKVKIDSTQARTDLRSLLADLGKRYQALVNLNVSGTDLAALTRIYTQLVRLDKMVAKPTITMLGEARALQQITAVSAALDRLDTQINAPAGAGGGGGRFGFLTGLANFRLPLFGTTAPFGLQLPAILATVGGVHLLVDAVAEVAAVVIPATIAFTAFGAAAVPTVRDLGTQMHNVYTVTQATGQAIPPLTGGFSKVADAVKPQVYVLFGDALAIINAKTGEFQKLAVGAGSALDQLAGRATVALQSSGMSGFLKNGAADLQAIGTFFGNLFGIVGNVLKTLPGYAQDLLGVLVSVSHGLEVFTSTGFVQGTLKAGLAFHGIALYAGLAGFAVSKVLGPALSGVSGMALSAATKTEGLGAAGALASRGFLALAGGAEVAAALPWGWIAVAGVAIGILVYRLLSARDATQQWVASLQGMINLQQSFTGVIATTQIVIDKIAVAQHGAATSLKDLSTGQSTFGASSVQIENALARQQQALKDTTAGGAQYRGELALENWRLNDLVNKFGSVGAAQAIWNTLHLKSVDIGTASSATWKAEVQQALAYENAIKAVASAMGQSGTAAYNAALNALNNTFITGTLPAIQQVVTAEGNLMNVVLGGRQGFITFQQDIQQMGTDAQVAGASIGGLGAQSLTLASDFYSTSVPAAQALIGKLQEQGISTHNLSTVVATSVGQMLSFAGSNVEARSVLVALINNALGPGTVSLQNLNRWVGNNQTTMGGFNSIVAKSTIAAGGLAGVLQNDLTKQFQADLLQVSGANDALRTYTSDLVNNQTATARGRSDRQRLITDLENTGMNAHDATAFVDGLQKKIDGMHGKVVDVDAHGSGSGGIVFKQTLTGQTKVDQLLFSARGALVPGRGSGDTVHAMLTPGEAVVPTHLVPMVAPLLKAHRVPGFASGGFVGPENAIGRVPSWMGSAETTFMQAAMTQGINAEIAIAKAALAKALQAASAYGAHAGPGGGAPLQNALLARQLFPWPMSMWQPFQDLAMQESGFSQYARNASSGAYGIAQALPESKYPFAGTAAGGSNPTAQLTWMFGYIGSRYGNPVNAENHELAYHWYGSGGLAGSSFDNGGWLMPGATVAINNTGKPERVGAAAPIVLEVRAGDSGRYSNFLVQEIQHHVTVMGGDVQVALGQKW